MHADSLLLHAPRRLAWVRAELTPPGPGEVWAETLAGAVSVGTEGPLYRGDARATQMPSYPLMTGYESLARVVEIGEGVDLKRGDRVVATYGHRTAARVRADTLMRVPEDVPVEVALLAILSNDTSRGVGKLKPNDAVLVTGAGTIGLLTLHRLRWLGVAADVLEPLASRRSLALALGARSVFAPEALPADLIYAAGVECSSRQSAFATLQRHLKPNARICVLADGNLEPLTLTPEFHTRELSVVASSDGEDYPAHAAAFYNYWLETRAPLTNLFTRRVSASDLPNAFGQLLIDPPVKIFVSYA